ncbi:MAG TPA: hypothetical protein VIM86_13625 [Thermodesulfobacteriota bacterium]
MTQRILVIAAALAAASTLAAAGRAAADCYDGHTVASKETTPTVSVQPSTTLPAPKPAEASTAEVQKGADTTTRTAEARPAVR